MNTHRRSFIIFQRMPILPPITGHIAITAQQKEDIDFKPVNEISEEVRNMISSWERAHPPDVSEITPSANDPGTTQASPIYAPSDFLQPPQRYRRVSKRAHVG